MGYVVAVQVFLIRHAHAMDETLLVGDAHRPLSAQGRIQAKRLGEKLRWYDCGITHVWSSPLVRAVQTAELVVAGFDEDTALEIVPALAPDGSVRNPCCSYTQRIAAWVATSNTDSDCVTWRFKIGQLCSPTS